MPGVTAHQTLIFLARENKPEEEEKSEGEEKMEKRTMEGLLGELGAGREDCSDERRSEVNLDSELELVRYRPPPRVAGLWRQDPFLRAEDFFLASVRPPPVKVVAQYDLSDDDRSTVSDEPKRKTWKIPARMRHPDVNMYSKDYWLARKKVKTLRVGNEMAVINTLNLMTKMDFNIQDLLYGIVDSGGLETLLNILDYKGVNTKLNALKLLDKMAQNEVVKGIMINQGIPDSCFMLLTDENSEIVLGASKILLKLCELTCMRSYCRKSKGLEVLLEFGDMKPRSMLTRKTPPPLSGRKKNLYDVSVNCLKCLDLLFSSKAVRLALYQLGFLPLLKKLISSENPEFYRMGIRMITKAASLKHYRDVFIEEGLMEFIYKTYKSNDPSTHLEMLRIIHKCIDNGACKCWMMERGFYEFLLDEFPRKATKELKFTMACIIKFVNIEKYRKMFDEISPIGKLFQLFDHPTPKIREYAGYLMGQVSRYPKNFSEIAGAQNFGVLKLLDYVQTSTDYKLIAYLYKVICDLSFDDKIYWDICDVTDPIGILWHAVTQDHPKIHEYGCSAIVPYIGPMPDSIERVLRFPGAVHDLLNITYHADDGAKAGAVTLLARLCQFGALYGALVEEGFDQRLLDLAKTATHPRLRYAIGYGFGSLSRTCKMSFSLGKRGAVQVLLDWLVNDNDQYAQLGIVTGLWKLSYEPINCKAIIQAKVAQRLTYLTVGKNECLQNSVAGLLSNMRYLARAAESLQNKHKHHTPGPTRGISSDPDLIHPFQYADDKDDCAI